MSEKYSGIAKGFMADRLFTAAEIDDFFGTDHKIPMAGSTSPMNWKQVMYKDGFEITLPLKVLKLGSGPEGISKIVQDEDEGPDITLDLVDVSLWNMVKMLQIGDDAAMTSAAPRLKSNYGKDLSAVGLPLLIYHAEFDFNNKGNIPLIGHSAAAIRSNTLPSQSGVADNKHVILDSGASAVNDAYNDMYIEVTHSAVVQRRKIVDYVGATKTAEVDLAFDTDPVSTDTYSIFAAAADTKAFLFFNATILTDRKIPLKKPQQTISVQLGTVVVDGTEADNLAVYGSAPLDLSRLIPQT
jgi:hypothetical protein